jgi:hypothetical protein
MAASTQQAPPDLHFHVEPLQTSEQVMVHMQICDNFGLTISLLTHPQIARLLGKQLIDKALEAEQTVVKPPSLLS